MNPEVSDMFWPYTLATSLLLGSGGLVMSVSHTRKGQVISCGLIGLVILFTLTIGLPMWIPYPHMDYLMPVVPFFAFWTMVGWLIGLLYIRALGRSRLLIACLVSVGITLFYVLLTSIGALRIVSSNLGWSLYIVPAGIAGTLLFWLLTSHQMSKAFYVLGWFVATVMWLLPHYLGELNVWDYTRSYASSLERSYGFSPTQRLAQAEQGDVVATIVYLTATLLLLVLPFCLRYVICTRLKHIPRTSAA